MNQKIIIAAEIFPPDIGGPATYSKKIAEQLVRLGWQVKLVCYSRKKEEDNFNFKIFRIIRSRFKPLHYYRYFKVLKNLALDTKLIYAQGPVASGWLAWKIKKVLPIKLIVKVVGDYAWEQARNTGRTDLLLDEFQAKNFGGKIGRLQKIERQVCQGADKVIVPSQYLKKIVAGWGIEPNKIEVIYNSFSAESSTPQNIKDKNLIISVGRLVPWKGFDTLIRLMPILRLTVPGLKLAIYGQGPDQKRLENLIQELKLDSVVTLQDSGHDQLMAALSQANLFVLNTGYEGLSHTILEAMAAKLPVITTKIGGNPELITDNDNGLLVEYNNSEQLKEAILKLYNNPELQAKFIESSQDVLKKFTFENMVNQTVKVLEST